MGASGSNCNETWEDEMARDLSRNRAYCAAREAISKQHRGWEKKLGFVGRIEKKYREARLRASRLDLSFEHESVMVDAEEAKTISYQEHLEFSVIGSDQEDLECSVMG